MLQCNINKGENMPTYTYSQVKEFWSNYFKNAEQFVKDWQKDVLESFKLDPRS